jgi:hypothetical protein
MFRVDLAGERDLDERVDEPGLLEESDVDTTADFLGLKAAFVMLPLGAFFRDALLVEDFGEAVLSGDLGESEWFGFGETVRLFLGEVFAILSSAFFSWVTSP